MPYKRPDSAQNNSPKVSPLLALGGFALAGVAGYVNAAALAFFHIPISHMSGAVTHLGIDVTRMETTAIFFSLLLIGSFVAGAVCSGIVIGGTHLNTSRRYGISLVLEGFALLLAALFIHNGRSAGPPLAAFACGLQNGMASSYMGLIVRTTHLTGILTDIGVLLGQFLRLRKLELWKLGVLGAIFVGFFGGTIIGAFAVTLAGDIAFVVPGVGCILAGTIYFGYVSRQRYITAAFPSVAK